MGFRKARRVTARLLFHPLYHSRDPPSLCILQQRTLLRNDSPSYWRILWIKPLQLRLAGVARDFICATIYEPGVGRRSGSEQSGFSRCGRRAQQSSDKNHDFPPSLWPARCQAEKGASQANRRITRERASATLRPGGNNLPFRDILYPRLIHGVGLFGADPAFRFATENVKNRPMTIAKKGRDTKVPSQGGECRLSFIAIR